nr:nicotinamide-nucleotide amidohydrolase family protein [Pseudooceanicola sp. HF7]
MAAAVLAAARAARLSLATAESCTGGLVSATLTAVPGSSDVMAGGVVSYSNAVKTALLGVRGETLAAHGAVSEEVALEMALGASERLGADLAVSITGIAGPGGSEHKPEGRVCFALAQAGHAEAETVEFGALGRDEVRRRAADHALSLLLAKAEGT